MLGMQTPAIAPEASFELCRLIGRTHSEIVLRVEEALTNAGMEINFSQYLTLKHLGDNESIAPGELARHLNYNPGAMTRVLDKLEQLGYLTRIPHPDDRRSLRLELTATGRKTRARLIACGNAAAKRVFARFTHAERQQLRGLLVRILSELHDEREPHTGA